jgi:hypothetical protein
MLMESIPVGIRRRYGVEDIKWLLEEILDDVLNPCDYGSSGDFISEVCNMASGDISYDYEHLSGREVSSKDKDNLYDFIVDNFADSLKTHYDNKKCE